jgi:C-terminal processing protease CtpA/Prc
MSTSLGKFSLAFGLFSALGLLNVSLVAAQQPQPTAAPAADATRRDERRDAVQPAREQVRDTARDARDTAQDAREGVRDTARDARQANQDTRDSTRDANQTTRQASQDLRQDARGTARDNRQGNQDTREAGRDTVRDNRQETRDAREGARDVAQDQREDVRDARRDVREARREFRAERVRSGDLGLWLRRAANQLLVSDLASGGAITQTGLKEGDQIISVNGQTVSNEREFVDRLFASQDNSQPVPVVVSRNGKQQTIQIQPKTFVDEYTVGDANSLSQYGIIIDDSVPDHMRVQAVVPRSPAFYAGVRSGDEITGLRGQRIKQIADLVRGLASSAGSSTQIDVNRNNQTRQLDIDIPDENAGEARTALRPNLDQPNQPNITQPNTSQPRTSQPTGQPGQPLSPPPARQPQNANPQNLQPRLLAVSARAAC